MRQRWFPRVRIPCIARQAILLCKHGGRLGLLRHLAHLLAEETPAIASIHAENMKNDLPGIRQLEREFQKEEEQLMKGANLDETKQPN